MPNNDGTGPMGKGSGNGFGGGKGAGRRHGQGTGKSNGKNHCCGQGRRTPGAGYGNVSTPASGKTTD